MSCDKLVYDLSQEIEGSPNIFIRKDWINVMDNQNQNYQNNQCIIDTSQIANSNKFISYREGYLAVPMLLSVRSQNGTGAYTINDYAIGLKNWFGQIIHSLTLDYNGTTIVQQTPFCNMWNSFKLLTTLSWADVATQGATIGFYPDTSDSWSYITALGVINHTETQFDVGTSSFVNNQYRQSQIITTNAIDAGGAAATVTTQDQLKINIGGNYGLGVRTKWIAYNSTVPNGSATYNANGVAQATMQQIWKSNISSKLNAAANTAGLLQISVMATIYLKHIHSFFNMVPLLKGVFMKLTLNLNNAQVSATENAGSFTAWTAQSYVGGVVPIMIPSTNSGSSFTGDADFPDNGVVYYDLMVGDRSYNPNIIQNVPNFTGNTGSTGTVAKSVYLYVPAYSFNDPFDKAYLSNNIKQIKYTDIYQYQVLNIPANTNFNNLITNGIANIKSVLIIPFYSQLNGVTYNEFTSPFDPAGCGCTAPMVSLGNFNVQISGSNAIYNTQRYTFEEWNNQLYGQNAVNGGLTDGLTSGLIDFNDFQHQYSYYYVNVERMLPVEQSVPKSVQILGTNYSTEAINLYVFVEYGVQVSIDVLTGARV